METAEKKEYEIAFLAKEETGAQDVVKLVKRFEGEITSEGTVEKIPLAYKIKKESVAYFGYLHASLLPKNIKPLDHELSVTPGILRVLIITPPFQKNKARPTTKPTRSIEPKGDKKKVAAPMPLTNEALEKKIEEILQD